MKKCKRCQTDIDDKAKVCHNCGKKQGHGKIIAIVVVVVLLIAIFGSSSNDDSPKSTGSSNNNNTKDSISEKIFSVGESIEYKSARLIVNSINFKTDYEYHSPDSGNEFIEVNVTLENIGDSELSYNTYDFSMVTSQGNKVDIDTETYTIDGGLSSGELIKNGKVTGTLVFEVPQNDSNLILYYSSSLWSEKYVKIDCTKK